MADRTNILISEPHLMEMGMPYLPLVWGILKTHWERDGPADQRAHWLEPLRYMGDVDLLLRPYESTRIDVLGLSCYTWNWRVQCLIAQRVKARHPHCLVVAGGPEPDYKDHEFFARHPYIDAVAVKDGELTFSAVVSRALPGAARRAGRRFDPDLLADVGGLYLPGASGEPPVSTGPAELPTEFVHSPYLAQRGYYESLLRPLNGKVVATWETNRGCPYGCSFCDWGSNTMSRVRRFDLGRIEEEIDWFGRARVGFIMVADANFGMLPRDLDIAKLAVRAHARHGYPQYISYNTAKNHPDRTVAIARTFLGSGLSSAHVLSVQHTDPGVLAATNRANISVPKQLAVVRDLRADDVPIYVQLILGIPGDSHQTWKRCFSDLMEWGVHAYYWVFPYNLLPNAPAADPAFRERWAIETLDRYVLSNHGMRRRGTFDPVVEARSRLIVSTVGFSRADWVRMNVYASCVKALHNCAVTQSVACYLRFTHQVPYARFYDALIEEFLPAHQPAARWYQALVEHYERYLADEWALDFMDVAQLPGFDYQLDPSRWLYTQICLDIESFFDSLGRFLPAAFPGVPLLADLLRYQKNLIVLPSYDRQRGASFPTGHDWVSYFARVGELVQYAPVGEPDEAAGSEIVVSDDSWTDEGVTLPLDWGGGAWQERWERWISTVAIGRNSARRNNFNRLRLVPAGNRVAAAGTGVAGNLRGNGAELAGDPVAGAEPTGDRVAAAGAEAAA